MLRVLPAGYLSIISQRDWDYALRQAANSIKDLQKEVREKEPNHPLLGLLRVVSEEELAFEDGFYEFMDSVTRDQNLRDTPLYAVGRYIERLALIIS